MNRFDLDNLMAALGRLRQDGSAGGTAGRTGPRCTHTVCSEGDAKIPVSGLAFDPLPG